MLTLIHQYLICCTQPYHRVNRWSILMVKSDRDATAENMLNSIPYFPRNAHHIVQYTTQKTLKSKQYIRNQFIKMYLIILMF
jgi:hypothetical protein